MGLILGSTATLAAQSCCGPADIDPIERGTYQLVPEGGSEPELESAELWVSEHTVALDYVMATGEVGVATWTTAPE